jgi:hypothetical protein
MSFKKNRSGVPYLKNEMPRVLLSGETDVTTLQEKEECLQAFRDSAEAVLGRHHKAFLSMFKQMMVGVFGPGMEHIQSSIPSGVLCRDWGVQLRPASGSQPPLQGQRTQPPPQSVGGQPIQPPPHSAGSQPVQPPL